MVTFPTFDVLDKELTGEVKSFNSIIEDYRWNNSGIEFHIDPQYWEEYYQKVKKYLPKLKWEELKYSKFPDLNKVITTNDLGIYLFVIRPDNMILSYPQFVMYVGISGEDGSNRPLKERINDYFNIGNIKKRKKLHGMLKKYYHNTWLIYSLIKNIKHKDLEQLEEDLHGYFIPPANTRDYPVRIKSIIQAQFTR